MSSLERRLSVVVCAVCLVFTAFVESARAQPGESPVSVVCPANIAVTESAVPVPGWTIGEARASHRFERISIYNGKAGGREYELAPDGEKKAAARITQTWDLKAYRTMNIFLRCRYRDTSVVLLMDLPPAVKTCTLRFSLNAQGRIAEKSDMDCR